MAEIRDRAKQFKTGYQMRKPDELSWMPRIGQGKT